MAERICYFQEPLDRLFVTLPCGCPFLSSVCTGWLGSSCLALSRASEWGAWHEPSLQI